MRTHLFISLLLACGALPLLHGQAAPGGADSKEVSVSKVERKDKAPVSKEILRVKLPKPYETTLDNGITVLIMEDHRLPSVSMAFSIAGAGGLLEPAGKRGMADVVTSMLREGTKTRNSRQIAEDLDRVGVTFFAGAPLSSEAASLRVSGLSDNVDAMLALAADLVLNPSFAPDELAKLKQRIKVGLRQQRSNPEFLLTERFSQAVLGAHPAAVTSITEQTVDALTPEDLAAWHRERFTPQNTILGIAGDVRPAEFVTKLKAQLSEWKRTDFKPTLPPDPARPAEKRVFLVARPSAVQTNIAIGTLSIDRRNPDYVPLTVMNKILGGGPTARLFLNLREEKGYTYGVYSSFNALQYPGPFRAGGAVRTEVTEPALDEFMKEFARIRDDKPADRELEEAKGALVANFALSLEQPEQLLDYAITRKRFGLRDDYWDAYPGQISLVTAEQVRQVAQKYLKPDSMQIAVVGDAEKIKPALEKLGPVRVYSMDGNPN